MSSVLPPGFSNDFGKIGGDRRLAFRRKRRDNSDDVGFVVNLIDVNCDFHGAQGFRYGRKRIVVIDENKLALCEGFS